MKRLGVFPAHPDLTTGPPACQSIEPMRSLTRRVRHAERSIRTQCGSGIRGTGIAARPGQGGVLRISPNMSRSLLLAHPSVPMARFTPARRRATRAKPDASFGLDSGTVHHRCPGLGTGRSRPHRAGSCARRWVVVDRPSRSAGPSGRTPCSRRPIRHFLRRLVQMDMHRDGAELDGACMRFERLASPNFRVGCVRRERCRAGPRQEFIVHRRRVRNTRLRGGATRLRSISAIPDHWRETVTSVKCACTSREEANSRAAGGVPPHCLSPAIGPDRRRRARSPALMALASAGRCAATARSRAAGRPDRASTSSGCAYAR